MDKQTAIDIIENIAGFEDESTACGEAFSYLLNQIESLELKIWSYELHKQLYEKDYEKIHKAYTQHQWLSKQQADSDRDLILKLQEKVKKQEEFINNIVEYECYDCFVQDEALDFLKENDA